MHTVIGGIKWLANDDDLDTDEPAEELINYHGDGNDDHFDLNTNCKNA